MLGSAPRPGGIRIREAIKLGRGERGEERGGECLRVGSIQSGRRRGAPGTRCSERFDAQARTANGHDLVDKSAVLDVLNLLRGASAGKPLSDEDGVIF